MGASAGRAAVQGTAGRIFYCLTLDSEHQRSLVQGRARFKVAFSLCSYFALRVRVYPHGESQGTKMVPFLLMMV